MYRLSPAIYSGSRFNSPDLSLPLTSSIIVTRGTATPTFTRASTRTIVDYQGLIRNLLSGEVGFTGARRVRNPWRDTENLAAAKYAATLCTKNDSIVVVTDWGQSITLARVNSSNFNASIRTQAASMVAIAPFVAGQRYLLSYYTKSTSSTDQFVYMSGGPATSGDFGHGAKLINTSLRRIWQVVQAANTTDVVPVITPTVALGSDTVPTDLYWHQSKQTDNSTVDVYIGGFAIEKLADSTYKDGIALIGDSTMSGGSGGKDAPGPVAATLTASRWLGALLNVNVYNRAEGGLRYDQLDTDWATQITPVALNCRYVVIQGGVNDCGQGRTLVQIQTSVNSMAAKAAADGLTAIYTTITPSVGITTPTNEATRLAVNAWLIATFPNVVDIAAVVADPANPSRLNQASGWVGDGTHYGASAIKAVGTALAAHSVWSFTGPSEYVSVDVLSSPFHGSNVDGVKCFDTTVAAGTTRIASTTLLGYLQETPTRTNLVLQNSNFGTTWAAVGTPTRVSANTSCGDITLDLIGDDDGAALEGYTQTVGFTADATKSVSFLIAQGTSTSTVVRLRDTTASADRLLLAVTWSGGVPTVTYTTGSQEKATLALGNSVYRIFALSSAVTAANTNSLEVYPATTAALAVANTGTVNVGGVQAENATSGWSLIPTTTATVSRSPDVLSYATTGLSPDAGTLTLYGEFSQQDLGGGRGVWMLSDGTTSESAGFVISPAQYQLKVVDGGVTQATISAGAPTSAFAKLSGRLQLNNVQVAKDGAAGTAVLTATMPTVTGFKFNNGDGTFPMVGNIRKIAIRRWNAADTQLKGLTA